MYYRESIDADIKREKEKQKAVSLSFIHFIDATLIDATLIDATLMTMLTLIMTCTASHISLASISVS